MIRLLGTKMKTKHVVVMTYQTSWPEAFKEICEYLREVVPKRFPIEHVGSTSVEGLSAKPVIDIDIVYEQDEDRLFLISLLEGIGYIHEGFNGIPFRDAFKYEYSPYMKHHLYVVRKGSKAYKDHVYLRDYLRFHAKEKDAYGSLKEELAKAFPYDIDSYMNGKNSFIEEVLQKAKRWMIEKRD